MAGFILPLLGGGLSALSNLFGGNQTTQNNNSTTNTSQTSGVTPNLSPQQQSTEGGILSGASSLLSAPNLSGYAAGQIQNNNNSSSAIQRIIANTMAARGLAGSPTAAAAQTGQQTANYSNNTNLLNQIPMLRNQLLTQNLGAAANAFRATPYGLTQTNTGTGTISSSSTGNSGSPFGMGASGFAGMGGLQALYNLMNGGTSSAPSNSSINGAGVYGG